MSVLTLFTGFLLCVLTESSNVEMSLLSHRSGSGSTGGSTNTNGFKHELNTRYKQIHNNCPGLLSNKSEPALRQYQSNIIHIRAGLKI